MKKAKNLLLISLGVIIASMIYLYSCRSYTGPIKKINTNDNGLDYEEEQVTSPDIIKSVVFNNACIIPALTVAKDNTLIAAVGDKNKKGEILIKTSKDAGTNWTQYSGSIKNDNITNGFAHPFFINCNNGEILLGIATTNKGEDTVSFYRGTVNGSIWNKENSTITKSSKATNQSGKELTPNNAFATYGNGVALKHGTNDKNTLLFPYYYEDATGSGVIYYDFY